jgi:hypothetical protein
MITDTFLNNIIRHYKTNFGVLKDPHITHCRNQANLGAAIYQAAIAKDINNKKHSHQHLIKVDLLTLFAVHLCQDEISFRNSKSFDEIKHTIEKNVQARSTLKGIGELTIYDTAIRIGAYKGLLPDKIYLHRGTRIGAQKLIPHRKLNSFIVKTDLPIPFHTHNLTEAEIEDILCIYKDKF